MTDSPFSADVTHSTFDERVLRRSREVPVLADFWAAWCAPCRALKPILEKLAGEYRGAFFLAKIDTDAEQQLAQRYGVRSLPTVKIFKGGEAVDGFMGALPESQVRAVLDRHLPRASDALVAAALDTLAHGDTAGAVEQLHEAVASDPGSDRAKLELARALLATAPLAPGVDAEVNRLLTSLSPEARNAAQAAALRARLDLARLAGSAVATEELERRGNADLDTRFELGVTRLLAGDCERGMADLLEVVKRDRKLRDDGARKALLACFEMLGAQDERVKKYRLLLSRALY
jgi:putative thioredoxin